MRRWFAFSPGKTGCDRCGSKNNGDLYSAGWFTGQLWCAPCLAGCLPVTQEGDDGG